jgi:SAM-dependent methyltransferase
MSGKPIASSLRRGHMRGPPERQSFAGMLMRWQLKAAAASVLSRVPGGGKAHRFLQVRLLKSLPINGAQKASYVGSARNHLGRLREHGATPIESAQFYEFGAGADLASPLAMWSMGVTRQIVTDVARIAEAWLCQDVLDYLSQNASCLGLEPIAARIQINDLADLRQLGIDYRAPVDARGSGLPSGSIDYVTSTSTMEHIPASDVPQVLAECRRVLKPRGLISFYINYADHFAASDSSIGIYNFLRFDDGDWARHNSPLHYQNRLRHVDYLRAIAEAGFRVRGEWPTTGTDAEIRDLEQMRLGPRFATYSTAELAVKNALIVAERR